MNIVPDRFTHVPLKYRLFGWSSVTACAAFVAFGSAVRAQTPDSPPTSAQELAHRYEQAHARNDTAAVARMFYWGAATDRTRMAVRSYIRQDLANAIKSVSVAPLDPHDLTQYTQNGVTYHLTLPAVAKLVIDFLPHTAHGIKYNAEQTSYFIGVRNGGYWLVTTEPAPSTPR